jgi:hypothetical protein
VEDTDPAAVRHGFDDVPHVPEPGGLPGRRGRVPGDQLTGCVDDVGQGALGVQTERVGRLGHEDRFAVPVRRVVQSGLEVGERAVPVTVVLQTDGVEGHTVHHRVVEPPPGARKVAALHRSGASAVGGETAFTALEPELSSPASCGQLSVAPPDQSIRLDLVA